MREAGDKVRSPSSSVACRVSSTSKGAYRCPDHGLQSTVLSGFDCNPRRLAAGTFARGLRFSLRRNGTSAWGRIRSATCAMRRKKSQVLFQMRRDLQRARRAPRMRPVSYGSAQKESWASESASDASAAPKYSSGSETRPGTTVVHNHVYVPTTQDCCRCGSFNAWPNGFAPFGAGLPPWYVFGGPMCPVRGWCGPLMYPESVRIAPFM